MKRSERRLRTESISEIFTVHMDDNNDTDSLIFYTIQANRGFATDSIYQYFFVS
jgi:hypothetical protein